MTGFSLALRPGNPPRIRAVDLTGGVGGGPIDAPDETPIEDTPDWEPGDGTPGDVVVRGQDIAVARLLENGVTYKNPSAGPGNKKVKAKLIEVSVAQGIIAPLLVDGDNYAGVSYDPAVGKVKASKKVSGVETALSEVDLAPVSGTTVIGAVARGTKMWLTVDGEIAGGPFTVTEVATALNSGLIAQGEPSATAWIGDFESVPVIIGFGRGYGLSFGGSA